MQKPIKFLLVDDLEANLLALEGLLRRDGLELLKAHSGAEALELLLVHDVALAILDVQMAGMDGFELAELMRGTERTRRVPIMFVTAGALDQQRYFRGYEAGAVDFLIKPIEPRILETKTKVFFELARQREELKRIAEEAQRASRAKDDFLAALSHELRTPLVPVLLLAEAHEQSPETPEPLREDFARIRANVQIEAQLIDDLLDVARIASGKLRFDMAPCHVHALIQNAAAMIRTELETKHIVLHLELGAPSAGVRGDAVRLQQVFWNLLKNAAKFTPVRGEVTIRTLNEGDQLRIDISDTGVGIAAAYLARIFEAFQQSEAGSSSNQGGLGLGLSISASIVTSHQGRIWATSSGPGQGATFSVTLPCAQLPEKSKPISPLTSGRVPPKRILLVEDHDHSRESLQRMLSMRGHTVTEAGTAAEAVAAVRESDFDLVISDLGLPDEDGYALIKRLQGMRHDLRGIALSGYGMEEDLRRSSDAGFLAHLVKPVTFRTLEAALAAVVP
jgi:signal transduction histidine kinase